MNEIIFLVEEDESEGGLFARALSESIYTQGDDIHELRCNIKDAVNCHFENNANKPKMIRLHFVHDEVMAA